MKSGDVGGLKKDEIDICVACLNKWDTQLEFLLLSTSRENNNKNEKEKNKLIWVISSKKAWLVAREDKRERRRWTEREADLTLFPLEF